MAIVISAVILFNGCGYTFATIARCSDDMPPPCSLGLGPSCTCQPSSSSGQGHVAMTTGTFWSPGRPRTIQQCVWLVVVWADGTKERPREDYPPCTYVREIWHGRFELEGSNHRAAEEFKAQWVPRDLAPETWARLGIGLDDF